MEGLPADEVRREQFFYLLLGIPLSSNVVVCGGSIDFHPLYREVEMVCSDLELASSCSLLVLFPGWEETALSWGSWKGIAASFNQSHCFTKVSNEDFMCVYVYIYMLDGMLIGSFAAHAAVI